ncbi:hypothetical protein FB390_1659 [Nocardia bhagyanarayanae]|uniref:Uncharacterized protein n=1 Tax=Nocardia bhagyanarayanae TaxID=1215925 RepID=A0A543F891_9NOCA|nr:hypothetical protein FB390_1659 [Nocardia bhagyanarayanae]
MIHARLPTGRTVLVSLVALGDVVPGVGLLVHARLAQVCLERCWARWVSYPAYLPLLVSVGSGSGVVIWLWLRFS